MVEQSDVVIAVWNGKPSGTGNTIRFAKEDGCKVRITIRKIIDNLDCLSLHFNNNFKSNIFGYNQFSAKSFGI